jgi:hypothetical protein
MTGCGIPSRNSSTLCPRVAKSSASSAEKRLISAMSAPATNAFSPAPVRSTTPASSARAISPAAAKSSWTVARFRELSDLGRLMVIVAILPDTSTIRFS